MTYKPRSRYYYIVNSLFALLCACSFDRLTDPADEDPIVPDDIVISEAQASNSNTLTDQFSETPDWIELYNKGDTTITLAGYSLSDDRDEPGKWTCGAQTIGPGSYAVVCVSGRDIAAFAPETTHVINLSKTLILPWADSLNNPRGNSHIRPVLFPGKVFGDSGGRRIISAHMYLDDNAHILKWQTAEIAVDLCETKDCTAFDMVRIIGTFQKGKYFVVRICQLSVENWLTFGKTLVGTGRENDTYDIRIVREPRLNRAVITGVVFAAGRVNDSITFTVTELGLVKSASYMHTSFKLSSDGEHLYLFNPRGKLVDRQNLLEARSDLSQGRKSADHSSWVVFEQPTPGRANDAKGLTGIAPASVASTSGGFFPSPVSVSISTGAAQVYYTLDGSLPEINSTRYTTPFNINETSVLRYGSFSGEMVPGEVKTQTYFINEKTALPIISLAADPGALFDPDTGIYMEGPLASDTMPYFGANFWLDKEIPVHIEFYEPDGKLGFKDGAGLRIFGNYSRASPKKSLALFFKNEYGKGTLSYTLFPEFPALKTFESFILRNNGGNFQRAMFEDALAGILVKGLGLDYQKYRPSVLFINGRYWGIHNIREKLNTGYLQGNHGYDPDQVDFIKGYGDLEAGDKNHYDDMLRYLRSFDIRLPQSYKYIGTQMDIDNYINYLTSEIYYANTDWPANNNGWWRPKTPDGKWRWIIYDVDGGFGSWGQSYDTNMLRVITDSLGPEWPNPPWSTFIPRTLLKNSEFKRRFINRAASLLCANFETAVVTATISRLADGIRGEISRDFERWDVPVSRWESSVSHLKEWARFRPDAMRKNYVESFSLGGTARLTLEVQGGGVIEIDGFTPGTFPFNGTYFIGNPVPLTATSTTGKFKQWSDGSLQKTRLIDLKGDVSLTAVFE